MDELRRAAQALVDSDRRRAAESLASVAMSEEWWALDAALAEASEDRTGVTMNVECTCDACLAARSDGGPTDG